MLTYHLDHHGKSPLYEQLYRAIRADIISGALKGGDRLPAKRPLAAHLRISQITVETAYGQLAAEGYIHAVPRSGYFVQQLDALPRAVPPAPPAAAPAAAHEPQPRFDFKTNVVDTDCFPFSTWAKLSRAVLTDYDRSLLLAAAPQGVPALREQIRRHTEHLEELVASRTRELLEAHRVAVVGETVACMAHTIKNLAAALEGSLFVLKQGMESGNREYLDDGWAMLEEDISRVRDKLLHLLRIGQQTELRECLVDPVQPVRHVVKRLEGRAASLSIALQFQDAADSDPIPLDAERLEGCLLNLVGNALEAFPAPGLRARPAEVRVEIARTPDALIYDVRDNGTGLSAEAAERLRDGLFTTKKDGTGFGLLGTRKALLEMGGRLLWENLPDSGALFRIVLPLRVERTPAAAEANHLREDS